MSEPARANGWLAEMHPAYFALVMATGIVSIACKLVGIPYVPQLLFALNLVFYPTLWVLILLRIARHPNAVLADLAHHGRAVGFFTMVAATSMFGSQSVVIAERPHVASYLWMGGIGLYVLLIYSVFTVLTVKVDKPTLAEGIHGGLVGVGGGGAISGGAGCPGSSGHVASGPGAVLLRRDVARWRHALLLDHRADFLSLHLLHARPF